MSLSPNLVIIQLLHAQSNHSEFLRMCWEKLSVDQKREIFYFLYLAKQYKTFLTILRHEINNENPFIPWTHLFAILIRQGKVTNEHLMSFLGSRTCEEEMGQFRLEQAELNPRWEERRKTTITEHESKKGELLKALEFARQQGLKDQKVKILAKLKKLFPKDKDVDIVVHSEKEYQARQSLNRIFAKRLSQVEWHGGDAEIDKKELAHLLKIVKKHAKKTPALALDFVIMFYQMELYKPALLVFDLIKEKSANVLWHELHISIEAKQFARALSVISMLRRERLNTDHSFSLLYFQALALHGLGQRGEAKQIVRDIVKIRPNFRSATSLLLEWESEQ